MLALLVQEVLGAHQSRCRICGRRGVGERTICFLDAPDISLTINISRVFWSCTGHGLASWKSTYELLQV